jgi:hypothetical protein
MYLSGDVSTAIDPNAPGVGDPGTGLDAITVSAPGISPWLGLALLALILWALSKGD